MDFYDVIVVGGGYSGLTAVDRITRRKPLSKVLLIDNKREFVERIRLHQVAAGYQPRIFEYEPYLCDRGAAFGHATVHEIHTSLSTLRIEKSDGSEVECGYRYLVMALGSRTNRMSVPGISEHAICLDTIEEVATLSQWAKGSTGRLLVVGGGLTAFEAATEFAECFPRLQVTLVTSGHLSSASVPGGYNKAAVEHLRYAFGRLRIQFLENSRVEKLETGRATLIGNEVLDFDRCIWAGGFGVSDIPRRSGIEVAANGRVICTSTLQSVSNPNIIATGDIAEVIAEPAGPCRMSCAVGRPMGEAAAATVVALLEGVAPPPFRFGYTFRCVSLGRTDGLIQFVDFTDRPTKDVWIGERAARWKEYVCQRTVSGVGLTDDVSPPDTPPTAITSQAAMSMMFGEG